MSSNGLNTYRCEIFVPAATVCPNRVYSPSTLSATISLEIYASFEFQPMLGDGEQLRQLTITMEQLLDRDARDVREWVRIRSPDLRTDTMIAFALFPKDGDVVSPCSSIQMTIEGRKCKSGNLSISTDLGPHCVSRQPASI